MAERPYTLLSCSVSMDGYLDGGGEQRLLLSNDADFERVDRVRAANDAILVGAGTIRRDDPRLRVRCDRLRAGREAAGLAPSPIKVTVTGGGGLDPGGRFFTVGAGPKLVYCPSGPAATVSAEVGHACEVVVLGESLSMASVSADLHRRGVRRLMVEGGSRVLTQFLTEGLADELQLVVAPLFVGDPKAPRFVGPGRFPWSPDRRATLVETRAIGDVALLRYALSDRFQP